MTDDAKGQENNNTLNNNARLVRPLTAAESLLAIFEPPTNAQQQTADHGQDSDVDQGPSHSITVHSHSPHATIRQILPITEVAEPVLNVPTDLGEDNDSVELESIRDENQLSLYDIDGSWNKNATSTYLSSHSWDPSRAAEYNIAAAKQPQQQPQKGKADTAELLGTVKGVFMPTLQNIFGIIMFVRLPWITGMAGVGGTLVIIAMAISCSLLTILSMSAIATNGVVRAGGAYYMISRSLGKEFGVSVGVLLYLATLVSAALYVLGAVELLVGQVAPSMSLGGGLENDGRLYGSALLILLALISLCGLRIINRFSMLFFLCVSIAIVTIFVGLLSSNRQGLDPIEIVGLPGNLTANLGPGYDKPDLNGAINPEAVNFFSLFAIFFPTVTGIMAAGTNKSGNLRDPGKSIPRGTLAATLTSTLIFVLFVFLFGTVSTGPFLRTKLPSNGLHVAVITSPVSLLTLIGCIFSSAGAALQCLTGSSRMLCALAKDNAIPLLRPFQVTRRGEPLRSLLLSFLLIECAVLVGNLDAVAPIATMLILVGYAFMNLSTALLSLLQYPNWRPSWKFYHWSASLFAALLCVVYMFLINWIFALIAIVLVIALYKYSEYTGAQAEWGDGLFALNLSIAQRNLLALERYRQTHAKNWRPQIMAILDMDKDQLPVSPMLLSFLSQLRKSGGLAIVTSVLRPETLTGPTDYQDAFNTLRLMLKQFHINGFPQLLISDRPADAKTVAVQSTGLGVLCPNTILMAYPTNWRSDYPPSARDELVKLFTNIIACDKVLILLKANNPLHPYPSNNCQPLPPSHPIDVYWIMHDGGVLTLLPYLLKKHRIWKRCPMRVFCIAQPGDGELKQMKSDLMAFLKRFRIDAEPHIVDLGRDDDITEFTYEKTLRLQQRQELLMEMRLQSETDIFSLKPLNDNPQPTQPKPKRKPDKQKEEFIKTSMKLNKIFKRNSSDSSLIFCSLPPPAPSQSSADYLEYLDVLTQDLPRVVLIKGSGMEVVTAYF